MLYATQGEKGVNRERVKRKNLHVKDVCCELINKSIRLARKQTPKKRTDYERLSLSVAVNCA